MQSQGFSLRFNGIIGFIFMVLIMVALFFIAKGIFTLLAWLSPLLLVGALVINYKTVLNYLRFMLGLLQRSPLSGIIAILLSVFGFPVVAGILFGKAILDRKVRKLHQAYASQEATEYADYEEVVRPENEKFELPPLKKEVPPAAEKQPGNDQKAPEENRYKDLF